MSLEKTPESIIDDFQEIKKKHPEEIHALLDSIFLMGIQTGSAFEDRRDAAKLLTRPHPSKPEFVGWGRSRRQL